MPANSLHQACAETRIVRVREDAVISDDPVNGFGQVVVRVKAGIEKRNRDIAAPKTFVGVQSKRRGQRLRDVDIYVDCIGWNGVSHQRRVVVTSSIIRQHGLIIFHLKLAALKEITENMRNFAILALFLLPAAF